MATIVLAGTFDSKGLEYEFARKTIADSSLQCRVVLIDIGYIQDPDQNVIIPDIKASEIASKGGCDSIDTLRCGERENGYQVMSKGLTVILKDMWKQGKLHGVFGVGGTCGSSMLTAAMRELPLGLPKVMVSTAASTPASLRFYGLTDLTLVNCVTDIFCGVNRFNRQTISNASLATAYMAIGYWQTQCVASSTLSNAAHDQAQVVAISMMGGIMPCVKEAHDYLKDLGYEVVIFHTVGLGGKLMEKLIGEGRITGVLDISLLELTCEFFGGIFSAGPQRLEQAGLSGTPQVVSLGAVDVIGLGAFEEVCQKFPQRKLYKHNEQVTAMRTSSDECIKIATVIAEKLNKSKGPCALYIPKGGLTLFSMKGGPLHDPEVDAVLFETIKAYLNPNVVQIVEMEDDINSKAFARAMVDTLHLQIRDTIKSNPSR